eukprot:NODE_30268_length_423_cov_1.263514.p1 GENE.NODE_30268_length_423_cov_1.263514~~NODE_30268_length_423_cov_1.263514.p1  ORF type:complete len:69 (+),score=0.26 NODE_30268_length_423_cov_1.263514:174-380(+)
MEAGCIIHCCQRHSLGSDGERHSLGSDGEVAASRFSAVSNEDGLYTGLNYIPSTHIGLSGADWTSRPM